MKVLVIGSGGQLGTDCVTVLGAAHEVVPIDYPEIDLGSRDSVLAACRRHRPEAIVNCAAFTAVDRCETERETARRINGDGPGHIGAAANELGSRVVHVSTDYVFDGRKAIPEPYFEDDPVNPLSEYGRSKRAGEENLLQVRRTSMILRTAWLYSANGPNFLLTMLKLALSDPEREFTIVDDQYGSLTWSDTLARQICRLLDTPLAGIIHATADGHSSWFEAACYFLARMEITHSFVPCPSEAYPTPAHRPANSILANGVLDDLGLSEFTSWQADVDRFVAAHRQTLLDRAHRELAKG